MRACLARSLVSRLGLALSVSAVVFLPSTGFAKDKKDEPSEEENTTPSPDEFEEEGSEDDDAPPKRLEEADKADETDPDKKDDEEFSDDNDADDLQFNDDSEQETVKPREEGEDTAQIYRDFQKKVSEMNADEEQIKWEAYLQKYPKSLFRDRIESRMDDLSNEMFSERIPTAGDAKGVDGADREINFANGWRLMGLDPKSKISAGFELGIPNWFGLHGDFEYQILRQLSAHAGVGHGLGGWEIAAGAKYAIIKSARTNTMLTLGVDLGLNTKPANLYPTVAPTLGFGQRVNVLEGLDLSVQVSAIPEFHSPINVRYTGGLSGELRANETVYAFAETQFNFRKVETSLFQFNTVSFGLRFVPSAKKMKEDGSGKAVVGVGANVPYLHDYWSLYQGAVSADVNYYL